VPKTYLRWINGKPSWYPHNPYSIELEVKEEWINKHLTRTWTCPYCDRRWELMLSPKFPERDKWKPQHEYCEKHPSIVKGREDWEAKYNTRNPPLEVDKGWGKPKYEDFFASKEDMEKIVFETPQKRIPLHGGPLDGQGFAREILTARGAGKNRVVVSIPTDNIEGFRVERGDDKGWYVKNGNGYSWELDDLWEEQAEIDFSRDDWNLGR